MTTIAAKSTVDGLRPVYAALTDVGQRRRANEDSLFAGALPTTAPDGEVWNLLVVADGVGGHACGEWASQQAIATLYAEVGRLLPDTDPATALRQGYDAANRIVWQSGDQTGRQRAASTLVAALVNGPRLWWANVGDSRAYLVRGGATHRISRDHSWLAEQVARGQLTEAEAAQSEFKNVITRSIGAAPAIEPDVEGPLDLRAGDVVVLCSDGLHGPLGDADLGQIAGALPPEWAARRLLELGNERGGPDNLSVIVCAWHAEGDLGSTAPQEPAIEPAKSLRPKWASRPRISSRWRRALVALALALGVAASVAGATIALTPPAWTEEPEIGAEPSAPPVATPPLVASRFSPAPSLPRDAPAPLWPVDGPR